MTLIESFLSSPIDRRLLGVAFSLTVISSILLKITPFNKILNLINSIPSSNCSGVTIDDIGVASEAAANSLPGTTCLTTALVAHALCQRHGHSSCLYFGINKATQELSAHSWVKSQEHIVVGGDVDLDRFEILGAASRSGS